MTSDNPYNKMDVIGLCFNTITENEVTVNRKCSGGRIFSIGMLSMRLLGLLNEHYAQNLLIIFFIDSIQKHSSRIRKDTRVDDELGLAEIRLFRAVVIYNTKMTHSLC